MAREVLDAPEVLGEDPVPALGRVESGGGERSPRSDEGSGWSGSSNDGFSTPKPAARPAAPKPAESFADNDPFGDDVPF